MSGLFLMATIIQQAWHQEAERRGLPNFRHTVESLPTLVTQETRELI